MWILEFVQKRFELCIAYSIDNVQIGFGQRSNLVSVLLDVDTTELDGQLRLRVSISTECRHEPNLQPINIC